MQCNEWQHYINYQFICECELWRDGNKILSTTMRHGWVKGGWVGMNDDNMLMIERPPPHAQCGFGLSYGFHFVFNHPNWFSFPFIYLTSFLCDWKRNPYTGLNTRPLKSLCWHFPVMKSLSLSLSLSCVSNCP